MIQNVVFFLSFILLALNVTGQIYFPNKNAEWEKIEPSKAGFDKEKLDSAISFINTNEYKGSKDLRIAILESFKREPFHTLKGPTKKRKGPAGMILKSGKVVATWGDTKEVEMTFSVTKSYLSTLCGLAVDDQLITSVNDRVGQYVWDGHFDGHHNSKITWDHLLTQSSDWYGYLMGLDDWSDRPPSQGDINDWARRELHEPGSKYEYNDTRVNLLAYSLLQVWRKPLPQVLKERIMDPIDASTTWRWYGYDDAWINLDGIKMQSVSGGGHHGGGIFINTEDHARLGLLFMNEGKWKDKQLISKSWISSAIQPSAAAKYYGYMWWLNTEINGKKEVPEAPNTIYYASGFGGNYIVVDTVNQLVIITRWLDPSVFSKALGMIYGAM
jgi:CubicO group peptidase (beta-lactamase class C family)